MALNLNSPLGLPHPNLKAFLVHAARHSPYYRDQDWAKNLLAGLPTRLSDIPVTPKWVVQQDPKKFRSDFDPPRAGPVNLYYTSGSTGQALSIAKSAVHFQINDLENSRLLAPWHPNQYPIAVHYRQSNSSHPNDLVEQSANANGTVYVLYSPSPATVGTLVREKRPQYLAASPNMVLSILQDGHDYGFLRFILTSREVVSDELRDEIRQLPNCRHADHYGSIETSLIGLLCPKCGHYHLATANSFVEILDENDEPVAEGSLGRVVATVFSNPATPLIRYDLGDIVRYSKTSACTPGQTSITQIYGRERMVFRLPRGGNVLPMLSTSEFSALGIRRYKLVQTALDTIEVRYQMAAPNVVLDVSTLRAIIAREMSPLFKVKPVAVSEFPLAPSGKYIIHERLIP